MCNMFVKKNGIFRPAGGGISFQVSDRVTAVIDRTYAVPFVWAWYRSAGGELARSSRWTPGLEPTA